MTTSTLPQALADCQALAAQHYENFPVASFLLAKKYRLPVAVIYAFALTADDIADELAVPNNQRLEKLVEYENELTKALSGNSQSKLLSAVSYIIHTYQLPEQLFYDLLTAFKQDTQQQRYKTYQDILAYCRNSANPVGRLLLHLFKFTDNDALIWSDNICTALQLINFLQDHQQDYHENNRIYFPQDELQKYKITEQNWGSRNAQHEFEHFIAFQIFRTRRLLQSGAPLGNVLPGRMGWEIRTIYYGGMTVLNKLEQAKNIYARPRLTAFDKIMIIIKALFKLPVVSHDP